VESHRHYTQQAHPRRQPDSSLVFMLLARAAGNGRRATGDQLQSSVRAR
jgi:hypothetical protein